MSFDDRLRDELRKATESHAIDADAALRRVKSPEAAPIGVPGANDPAVVPLVEEDAPHRRQVRARRIIGVAAAIALIAGAIALPFALRDNPHDTARRVDPKRTTPKIDKKSKAPHINPAALQAVTSALDATTNAGSFHVEYSLTEIASPTPTTTIPCPRYANNIPLVPARPPAGSQGSGPLIEKPGATVIVCGGGRTNNVTTTGYATVNVNPYAIKAVSNVSTFGPVTVRVDATNYWESAGSDSETTPTFAGQPLSSFAGLVEGTLGPREGAGPARPATCRSRGKRSPAPKPPAREPSTASRSRTTAWSSTPRCSPRSPASAPSRPRRSSRRSSCCGARDSRATRPM